MLKISAVYFMWNPEICQDPPTCGQDDLAFSWNSGFLTKFTCKRLSSDPKSQLFLDSSRKPHWYCHGLTLTKDWAIPVHSYPENQRWERHVQLTLETKYHLQMMPFQSEFGFWSMIGLAFVSSPTSIRQILLVRKTGRKLYVLIFSKNYVKTQFKE